MTTPIQAIVREAWPARMLLVGAVFILSIILGVAAKDASLGRLLIGLGVLPAFAAMLGAALGQGEHAGWAWALARPVSRRRWCLTHVALDVLTIGVALRIAWWILPTSVDAFLGARTLEPELLALPASAAVYLGTAAGTSRGLNAVRGLLSQVPAMLLVGFGALVLLVLGDWVDHEIFRRRVTAISERAIATVTAGRIAETWCPVVAAIGAAVHRLVVSLAALPQRLPRRHALRISASWVAAVSFVSWLASSPAVLLLGGPTVWVYGDAAVIGEYRGAGAAMRLQDGHGFVRLPVLYEPNSAYFGEVEAGEYRICTADGVWRHEGARRTDYGELRRCIELHVAPGETVVISASAFDQPAVFSAHRLTAWFLYPGIAATRGDRP